MAAFGGAPLFGLGIAPFIPPAVVCALGFIVFRVAAGLYGHILATVVSGFAFAVVLRVPRIHRSRRAPLAQLGDPALDVGAPPPPSAHLRRERKRCEWSTFLSMS